jgi:hypothetical protein
LTGAQAQAQSQAGDAEDEPALDLEGVGTVYCSRECKDRDSAGSSAGDTGHGHQTHGSRSKAPVSVHHQHVAHHHHYQVQNPSHHARPSSGSHSATSPSSVAAALDFSNRRNSRGASYRPLTMQRVPSSDDGIASATAPRFLSMSAGPSYSWAPGTSYGRVKSSDSLASLGGEDAGDRAHGEASVRLV